MTTPEDAGTPRDAGNWATKVDKLAAPDDKAKVGYNITGKKATGPQQGFGRLWQRTYSTDLGSAVGAHDLISDWKVNFGTYWPPASTFHSSLTGIEPGAVAPIEVGVVSRGPKLATGILVMYADEESFTFMTPQGHMFAGLITFSAEEVSDNTRVEIKILIRPSDPLWELAWPVAKRKEDVFWVGTLTNLAQHHGVAEPTVEEETVCVDRKRLWSNWRNIWHNSGIRSGIHIVTTPVRRLLPDRTAG
ncbi:MAG: hypothetical protein ABI720_01830 [Actinomycetes bacterium]